MTLSVLVFSSCANFLGFAPSFGTFMNNFVVFLQFLQFFAHACMFLNIFLHTFLVLILQTQSCVSAIFHTFCNSVHLLDNLSVWYHPLRSPNQYHNKTAPSALLQCYVVQHIRVLAEAPLTAKTHNITKDQCLCFMLHSTSITQPPSLTQLVRGNTLSFILR